MSGAALPIDPAHPDAPATTAEMFEAGRRSIDERRSGQLRSREEFADWVADLVYQMERLKTENRAQRAVIQDQARMLDIYRQQFRRS